MSRVQSFSVAPTDTSGQELIAKIKQHCDATGVSFSYIVIAALKKYTEEVLWPANKK